MDIKRGDTVKLIKDPRMVPHPFEWNRKSNVVIPPIGTIGEGKAVVSWECMRVYFPGYLGDMVRHRDSTYHLFQACIEKVSPLEQLALAAELQHDH